MESNKIYNENCIDTMRKMTPKSIDVILTSPPYNTNKHTGGNPADKFPNVRYDLEMDRMENEEYIAWIVGLFKNFQNVLNDNGVVIWNVSYGNENTEAVFLSVADIIRQTDFTVADVICWKKKSAMPNNCASNKLTRIWEE